MLLERRLLELRDQARCMEELLQRRVSSDEQRKVLGLLCKVHELEMENAEMQSHALLKDSVVRQKNLVVQRFEQHRHLCDELIQQQRQFIDGESLLVPTAKVCRRQVLRCCCSSSGTVARLTPPIPVTYWLFPVAPVPSSSLFCRCVADHRLLVPPRLQELYDVYTRELDERKLERAVGLDKRSRRQSGQVGLEEAPQR